MWVKNMLAQRLRERSNWENKGATLVCCVTMYKFKSNAKHCIKIPNELNTIVNVFLGKCFTATLILWYCATEVQKATAFIYSGISWYL